MSVTDPIADYLVRVRNAIAAKHETVEIPASKIKLEITKILMEEGFIQNFKVQEDNKQDVLKIFLKYSDGQPVITGLKQISKPGCRVYSTRDTVPKEIGGLGISILSTSRGVMTGHDSTKTGIGGEVLCEIW